jgi:hydroxyacylglutathione hydrolase
MPLKFRRKKKPLQLDVRQFSSQDGGKNEYLVIHDRQAAAIDATDAVDDIVQIVDQEGIELKYLLVSHAHPAHLKVLPQLKQRFGSTFCLHPSDRQWLDDSGIAIEPDRLLRDEKKLNLGKLVIRVLHTPGHSVGSLCFWIPQAGVLFSGSTLKKGGFGKIWGNSSMSLMLLSLKRLNYTIPSETVVYPRSGETTTMGAEAWMNCLRSH